MFARFTHQAREAVVRAQHEAVRLRHTWIGKEHLLLALAGEPISVAGQVLRDLGATAEAVEREVVRVVGTGPANSFGDDDAAALRAIGIDLDEVRRRIEETFGSGALDRPIRSGCTRTPFTPRAKQSLELAAREAKAWHHEYIGTEHILLGLATSQGGAGAEVMRALGLHADLIRARVRDKLERAS